MEDFERIQSMPTCLRLSSYLPHLIVLRVYLVKFNIYLQSVADFGGKDGAHLCKLSVIHCSPDSSKHFLQPSYPMVRAGESFLANHALSFQEVCLGKSRGLHQYSQVVAI